MTDVREQFERPVLTTTLASSCRVERISLNQTQTRSGLRSGAVGLFGLNRAIENKVIPSLVLAHARPENLHSELAMTPRQPAAHDGTALAEMMLAGQSEAAQARIETLRAEGHSLEAIYLQLLAPAAVELRRLWSSDFCGFAEATLALWRLQQLLRDYSVEFRAEAERQETGQRALLTPSPREKHDLSYTMFGLVLMSEFFRRDGWEAWIEPDPTSAEFTKTIREEWFDVVELLVSGDRQLDALAARIGMIRQESPNRSIGVMVYGQVFIEHPELVLLVGADLTATDARHGALQAQSFVRLTKRS
jgi:MerR family transcriptional regulator, light-induced transcriptional regulator